jgi:hypothetical protein
MEQLLAHLVGDYWLQPDWVAQNKLASNPKHASRWPAWAVCLFHALLYTLPFVILTRSWRALLVIGVTHRLIDHFGLGAKFSWLKNRVLGCSHSWAECKGSCGYSPDRPAFLTVWLTILVDNSLHLLLNYVALRWL